MCVKMHVCTCGSASCFCVFFWAHVEIKEQLTRVGFVFSLCGSWRLDSGFQVHQLMLLPTDPSLQPPLWFYTPLHILFKSQCQWFKTNKEIVMNFPQRKHVFILRWIWQPLLLYCNILGFIPSLQNTCWVWKTFQILSILRKFGYVIATLFWMWDIKCARQALCLWDLFLAQPCLKKGGPDVDPVRWSISEYAKGEGNMSTHIQVLPPFS